MTSCHTFGSSASDMPEFEPGLHKIKRGEKAIRRSVSAKSTASSHERTPGRPCRSEVRCPSQFASSEGENLCGARFASSKLYDTWGERGHVLTCK